MFQIIKDLFPCLFKEEKPKELSQALPAKPVRDLINYQLNDPNTPNLVVNIPVPEQPNVMKFTVKGFNAKTPNAVRGTEAGQAANVYATLVRSLNNMLQYRKLKKWPGTNVLRVIPRAGSDLNAYYDRKNLKFFYAADPKRKDVVFTCESVDIVAHELGHALLDTLRPDLWSTQAIEVWSFHEAFGDINAITTVMLHDQMLEYALKETNGNLMKHNVISRLAEEMGDAIYNLTKGRGGYKPGALRNAVNNFVYVRPETLPEEAHDSKLARECHSFGRLFVGVWYEIMVEIFNENKRRGMSPMDALKGARNYAYSNLIEALKVAPRSPRFYDSVAKAMLSVDRLHGDNYQAIMLKVFNKRKILLKPIRMLSAASWSDVSKNLEKQDEVIKTKHGYAVRKAVSETVKLSNQVSAMSMSKDKNPLFDLEIELANDSFYEMDARGRTLMTASVSNAEAIECAMCALNYLHKTNAVGNGWEISKGKLIRSHIQCQCHRG